jgi:hypothetical protein
MTNFFKQATSVFSAGCFGGLANSLIVWLFGVFGITAALGVKIAPALTPQMLYQRIVWGGLWGFLFLLPLLRKSYFSRSILYSLGPSLVQLFVVFPIKAQSGVMGIDLGAMTPVVVIFYNGVWGVFTGLWLRWVNEVDG